MKRILIVDDSPDYVRSLAHCLGKDFEVVSAGSLVEAQQRLDDSVRLALVDIRLDADDPGNRDGIRFLEWLRAHRPDVVAVMMSAYREFDFAVDALNLGASYFLRKPIQLAELHTLLAELRNQ